MELRDIKEYFDEKFMVISETLKKIDSILERQAEQISLTEKRVTALETRTEKRPTLECESFFKQHITSDSHIEYIKQKHREVHEEWDKAKKDEMRNNAGFIKNIISIIQVVVPIVAVMIMVFLK